MDSIKDLLPDAYAGRLSSVEELARLWAGYGHIYRLHLNRKDSAILKYISAPRSAGEQDESNVRKLHSYRVETNFYQHFSSRFNGRYGPRFTTPTFLARVSESGLLLSDLALSHPVSPAGREGLSLEQSLAALDWFAAFHASHWGYASEKGRDCPTTREIMKNGSAEWEGSGVWEVGTYNYLETRLEELESISPSSEFACLRGPLAFAIEYQLLDPRDNLGQTLVHGDAKAANLALRKSTGGQEPPTAEELPFPSAWLTSSTEWDVCMYDFQYVGVGVPTQDLIKFLCTAIPSKHLRTRSDEEQLLRFYYHRLLSYLGDKKGTYTWEVFMHQWKCSLLSWVRFTEGWGAWGNTQWLSKRGKEVLEEREWVKTIESDWKQRGREWGMDMIRECGLD
ncbi:unnamed protein product [Sympodiomycopsis kandeliae]